MSGVSPRAAGGEGDRLHANLEGDRRVELPQQLARRRVEGDEQPPPDPEPISLARYRGRSRPAAGCRTCPDRRLGACCSPRLPDRWWRSARTPWSARLRRRRRRPRRRRSVRAALLGLVDAALPVELSGRERERVYVRVEILQIHDAALHDRVRGQRTIQGQSNRGLARELECPGLRELRDVRRGDRRACGVPGVLEVAVWIWPLFPRPRNRPPPPPPRGTPPRQPSRWLFAPTPPTPAGREPEGCPHPPPHPPAGIINSPYIPPYLLFHLKT